MNAIIVKFGNKNKCTIKGYGNITNENFIVNHVAYAEGLKHKLVSISQLFIGIGNKVLFDEEGCVISNKITNEVLLNSK